MPVACYGLSSLIGSPNIEAPVLSSHKSELDLHRVFLFFAGLYFVVGIFNFVANSIVTIERRSFSARKEPLLDTESLHSSLWSQGGRY